MMKKLIFLFILSFGFLISTQAQVKVQLGINIQSQPVWGPTGYDHAEYYYMPEYDLYYDVPHRRYVYFDDGHWAFANTLPQRYHDVDLYHTHKVVLNERRAYLHHDEHMRQYSDYKSRHDQEVIRDSHEEKYWQIKDHPEHQKWHGRGHGREGNQH